jgi:hypothetical protein
MQLRSKWILLAIDVLIIVSALLYVRYIEIRFYCLGTRTPCSFPFDTATRIILPILFVLVVLRIVLKYRNN